MPFVKSWSLQDAKNKFSAVAELASHGEPQIVTRRGSPLVVIMSYSVYEDKIASQNKHRSLVDAFRDCPSELGGIIPPRKRTSSPGRKVVL